MPDFPVQYSRLCQALAMASHDVAVLSGDVHFGRVATIEIARRDRERPTRLFEVISSPMALVSLFHGKLGLAKGEFTADILTFPYQAAQEDPDTPSTLVGEDRDDVSYARQVESTGRRCEDHYMTLDFLKLGGDAGIQVDVRAHLLRKATR
jgi:hypothetical protein